jgi:DNA-binding MurR/RpiR family transcriptional regulator
MFHMGRSAPSVSPKREEEADSISGGTSIQTLLEETYHDLTPRQRRIADFVAGHTGDIAFLPLSDLADMIGVSGASIVRFCRKLGFGGFEDFRDHLRAVVRHKASTATRLVSTLDVLQTIDTIFGSFVDREVGSILNLTREIKEAQLRKSAELISSSRRVFIFGEGPAAAAAMLLEYRLRRFGIDTMRVSETGKDIFEKAFGVDSPDCIVLFMFTRFSEEAGILLDRASDTGASSIMITDLLSPEIAERVSEAIRAPRGSADYFQSMVCPILVAEAMTLAVGRQLGKKATESLLRFERLRRQYGYPRLGPSPAGNRSSTNRRERCREETTDV